jgi:hypothetical protein
MRLIRPIRSSTPPANAFLRQGRAAAPQDPLWLRSQARLRFERPAYRDGARLKLVPTIPSRQPGMPARGIITGKAMP